MPTVSDWTFTEGHGPEKFCEFTSFEQWVNKAQSWLGGVNESMGRYKPKERVVCIDAKGRVCKIGADFIRARDENAFPVTAYLR